MEEMGREVRGERGKENRGKEEKGREEKGRNRGRRERIKSGKRRCHVTPTLQKINRTRSKICCDVIDVIPELIHDNLLCMSHAYVHEIAPPVKGWVAPRRVLSCTVHLVEHSLQPLHRSISVSGQDLIKVRSHNNNRRLWCTALDVFQPGPELLQSFFPVLYVP